MNWFVLLRPPQSVHADLLVPATTTSFILTNFSLDTVYLIRGVAYTSLGPGPASTPVFFTLDPLAAAAAASGGRDAVYTAAGGPEELGGQAWFIALIAGVLFVLVCIFIMILVYRQISGSRKSLAAAGLGHQCLKELEIKVNYINFPIKGTGTRDLIWLKVVSLEKS